MKGWKEPKAKLIAPAVGPCHEPGDCAKGNTPSYGECIFGKVPNPW